MRVAKRLPDDVRLWVVGAALLVSLLAINGWAYQPRVSFSPYSWSYYELSQTFGGDLLRISTQRQYSWVSEYNVSFPPLWPAAIAATDAATGLGPASGILLNYAITGLIWVLLAFVLAAVVPSGVVAHPALAAAALMGCVVFAPGYMAEVVAARSIPLALVFWLVLLLALLKALRKSGPSRRDFAQGCLMGAAAGLGFLTRFDFLLPGGALLLVLAGLAWSDGRRRLLGGYSLVVLGLVGVWSAYSLVHFGVFLASDNARAVTSASPVFIDDFHPGAIPTLFDDPARWMRTLLGKLALVGSSFAATLVRAPGPLLAVPALFLGVRWFRGQRRSSSGLLLVIAAALIAAHFGTIVLSGYGDRRYWIPESTIGGILAWVMISRLAGEWSLTRRRWVTVAILAYLALFTHTVVRSGLALPRNPEEMAVDPRTADLPTCLPADARTLLLTGGRREFGWIPYRLGAETGLRLFVQPTNFETLPTEALREFVRRFQVTHVVSLDAASMNRLVEAVPTDAFAGCRLEVVKVLSGPA